ncbi:hypothetical protein PIB30_048411 [Stylosanthes scabra]|uniref:Uncharacterized protein n=1 Tax=Stylosanthes scabra TaxID=79078 RepID=A0ABU6RH48_9FABA|nr:hypothetical protein [Stylosanthes scabra]
MAEEYLGGRPPAGGGKNYAGVRMTWLRQRVQMTPGNGAPPDVLRQYARCYIMMMIWGTLFPDKTNNIVSLRWARQPGDEWVSAAGVIMDIAEIPTLLSTRQKRDGVPSCFTAEWTSADHSRHSRPTAIGVPKRVRSGRRQRFRVDPVHDTSMARHPARLSA